ncbi:MAG: hypothetical protein LBU16_00075 [Treponema sp.]|nr:hypothetical protein [Treponema sp.]
MVIVKRSPGLVIEKNIARIFRRIIILEYKSPDDYFSVYDFYKVLSYAALDKIAVEELTLQNSKKNRIEKAFKSRTRRRRAVDRSALRRQNSLPQTPPAQSAHPR